MGVFFAPSLFSLQNLKSQNKKSFILLYFFHVTCTTYAFSILFLYFCVFCSRRGEIGHLLIQEKGNFPVIFLSVCCRRMHDVTSPFLQPHRL